MLKNEDISLPRSSRVPAKEAAKRKAERTRYFVDKYINTSTEITPKWQRAIDTYNRAKQNPPTR